MNCSPFRAVIWLTAYCYFSVWPILVQVLCICSEVTTAEISERHQVLIHNIVSKIQTWNDERLIIDRPFITLSFAQSLDGKIASYDYNSSLSQNFPISGEESLFMTHALRSVHDAILVGGNTLLIDNPRLNNRQYGDKQPRPIILDADLKYIKALGSKRKVRNAIVCCSEEAIRNLENDCADLTLLPCRIDAHGRVDLDHALHQLSTLFDVRSIMVEGGATVLTTFASRGLIDCLCVTIAPKVIGRGLQALSEHSMIGLEQTSSCFIPLGQDCIFLSQFRR